MTTHLSCAETAKLVRQALKEAFPGVKFGVRSNTYSGGASIVIAWEDGPNETQVEAVVGHFKGAYFDGGIDYQGRIFHMLDGKAVSMGADYIRCSRSYSDAAVGKAIAKVVARYGDELLAAGFALPTVKAYRNGALWHIRLPRHFQGGGMAGVQADLGELLHRQSDRLKVVRSKTAGRVFVTHDDGYSMASGSGMSAVAVDSLHHD